MAEPASQMQAPPEESIDDLLKKHHAEIERVRALNTSSPAGIKDQQGEFERLGIDTDKLRAHYQNLQVENNKLLSRAKVANRRTAFTAWGAFLATAALAVWKREKVAPGNKLLQGGFIALTPTFVSVIAANIGSYFFNRHVRVESKELVKEAGEIFNRELAVAIENKQRSLADGVIIPEVNPLPGTPAPVAPKPAVMPRESFMAEAMKEKTTAQEAVSAR